MNERFWELVEQADEEGGDDPDIRDEVFARLIIQECSVALNPMLRDMVSRGQAYDLIKQHFGVEE